MQIFDGILHSQKVELLISEKLASITTYPKLGIVQIGENPASEKFISLKIKLCEKYNIPVQYLKLSSSLSDAELLFQTEDFFNDPSVSGVILQLPLPRPTLYKILSKIPPQKDVDALRNQYKLEQPDAVFYFKSPVERAVEYFISSTEQDFKNKKICVLGFGFLVGRPLAALMLQQQAKATVYDDLTLKSEFLNDFKNIEFLPSYVPGNVLNYQLVISSAGIPNLLKGQDIVKNSSVIDFGSSVVNGKTIGDLDLNSKLDHLNYVSPSPKGMGPLVVRFLVLNLIEHALKH